MHKSNEQLQLLRQYVKTLQNQMKSKNQQIRTLNIQIQSLSKNQNASSISRSQIIYTSNCNQCAINKQQLNDLKTKCSALESSARLSNSRIISSCSECFKYKAEAQMYKQKYQNLLKTESSSSIRSSQVIYSSNCNQCSSLKNQLQNLQQKYNSLSKQSSSSYSSFVTSSTTNQQIQYFKREYLKILDEKRLLQGQLLQIGRSKQMSLNTSQLQNALKASKQQVLTLRLQIHKKQEIIRQLRSQLMSYSQKITNLQSQIQNLARVNSGVEVNSQRLKYLNGQVQHYLALSNSLKSQIQVLKQENHSYILKIRELQNRPKQVQYLHVEPSFDFKQSILELRRQISDLSNTNILIQQQNQNLRLRLIQLSRIKQSEPQIIEVIRTQNYSPMRSYMEQQKVRRHYKKPHYRDNLRIKDLTPTKNSHYFEKEKYNDLQRRIFALQAQNENLKTNFYNRI